jgi:hypothetical protein
MADRSGMVFLIALTMQALAEGIVASECYPAEILAITNADFERVAFCARGDGSYNSAREPAASERPAENPQAVRAQLLTWISSHCFRCCMIQSMAHLERYRNLIAWRF